MISIIRKNYFHFLEASKKRWLIFTIQEFTKNKIPAGYTKKTLLDQEEQVQNEASSQSR